ncbi:helix-turn-helix domain-containing protein [Carboxylicivirga linearis]|uniref:Helix-turn-helix domain-containing protein n=1 Tax=Carboxylicivirga linearis TaxID=1628157 RepID=A0ABS5JW49_9BACT|nr:helix-turn-helix domain-containing protein [Carboxylicivirga linearis]MBS2098701.1 helix-turn-helix domain-containing protein [Carboxylicivirga linearis]
MKIQEDIFSRVRISKRFIPLRSIFSEKKDTTNGIEPDTAIDKPNMVLIGDEYLLQSDFKMQLSKDFNLSMGSTEFYKVNFVELQDADVIVLDLSFNSLELGRIIKAHPHISRIPLLFTTLINDSFKELQGLKLGAIDVVSLPVNYSVFKYKILNVLNHISTNKIDEINEAATDEAESGSYQDDFVNKAITVIKDNIDKHDYCVAELADSLCVSYTMLYRKIKKQTGYTAKQFIRVQRLRISESMLKKSDKTISEVAYMVGFTSPGYFSKCFSEHFGYLPSEIQREAV